METRKLQKTGGSTYIISLPKHWVTENNLKSGDGVEIDVDAKALRIKNPMIGQSVKRISIIMNKDKKTLERHLISAYIKGFDSIELVKKSIIGTEEKEGVRDLLSRYMGLEITNERTNLIEINSILSSEGLSIRSSIRRLSTITESMLEDLIKALEKKNLKVYDDVMRRDYDVNRLSLFILRRCHEVLEGDVDEGIRKNEIPDILLFARTIERIADHTKNIAANLKLGSYKKSEVKWLIKTGYLIRDLFKESTNAFFKKDMKRANEMIDESRNMANSIHKKIYSLKETSINLASIMESYSRCFYYISDLCEIVLNHTIEDYSDKSV